MNQKAIAGHSDVVEWRKFFPNCRDVNEIYSEFVAYCRFLTKKITPSRPQGTHVAGIQRFIAVTESILSPPNLDVRNPETASKQLKKVVLRQRTIDEHRLRDSMAFLRYSNSHLKRHESTPTLSSGNCSLTDAHETTEHLATHFASVHDDKPEVIHPGSTGRKSAL